MAAIIGCETLEKFHLGLAADGTSCAMVFVDDQHRSIACIASDADLNGFIVSLTRAAAEMARRRTPEAQAGENDKAQAGENHEAQREPAVRDNYSAAEIPPGPQARRYHCRLIGIQAIGR